MMTVNEVKKLTGVSVRTLQYYDNIGLLSPAGHTGSGYRLYDDTALERLQQILLFRELGFSLTEIRSILDSPDFDRTKALEQQIELLTLKKERLEAMIRLAREIKDKGELQMKFDAFDTKKIDEYAEQAKARWGNTKEYAEYAEKNTDKKKAAEELMEVFARFGELRRNSADKEQVAQQVKELQSCITKNYYTCSDEVLASLGQMYVTDEFRQNIDKAGGEGTAEFVSAAIAEYTKK